MICKYHLRTNGLMLLNATTMSLSNEWVQHIYYMTSLFGRWRTSANPTLPCQQAIVVTQKNWLLYLRKTEKTIYLTTLGPKTKFSENTIQTQSINPVEIKATKKPPTQTSKGYLCYLTSCSKNQELIPSNKYAFLDLDWLTDLICLILYFLPLTHDGIFCPV